MRALIEVESSEPENTIRAIEPDISPTNKFNARIEPKQGKIVLEIESRTAGGLLAGINSYMRLIKTTKGVEENE